MRKKKNLVSLLMLVLSLSLVVSSLCLDSANDSIDRKVARLEQEVARHVAILEQGIQSIASKLESSQTTPDFHDELATSSYLEKGITFLVYRQDSLFYWSTNKVPDPTIIKNRSGPGLLHLKNGWYFTKQVRIEPWTIAGFLLIKKDYEYNNEFLVNDVNPAFSNNLYFDIVSENGIQIHYNESTTINISIDEEKTAESRKKTLQLLFTVGVFLMIISLFLIKSIFWNKRKHLLIKELILFIFLLAIRVLFFFFNKPDFVFQSDLFSPLYYAGYSWIPSFGDLLLNALLFFYLAFIIFKIPLPSEKTISSLPFYQRFILAAFITGTGFSMAVITTSVFKNFILNSNIYFNISDIFEIRWMSIGGYFVLTLLLFSQLFFLKKAVQFAKGIIRSLSYHLIILCVAGVAYLFWAYFYNFDALILHVSFLCIVCLIAFSLYYPSEKGHLFYSTLYIIIFALITSFYLDHLTEYKEKEKKKIYAAKLEKEKDPIGVSVFMDISRKINNDKSINALLASAIANEDLLINKMEKYFKGYWSKYDKQFIFCSKGDNIFLKPDMIEVNCQDFFMQMISEIGEPTISNHLFFLRNQGGESSYLAWFTKEVRRKGQQDTMNIFIELKSKGKNRELGYPDLLIDQKTAKRINNQEYSYAKYYKNKLVEQSGKFNYPYKQTFCKGKKQNDFEHITKTKFNHLCYHLSNDKTIIVSKKDKTVMDKVSSINYFFLFFLLSVLLFSLAHNPKSLLIQPIRSLKSRMQFSLILIIFISIITLGTITVVYISRLYKERILNDIHEKTHSVKIELEHKIGLEERIDMDMRDYIEDLLIKFQNVFFTDINIFDVNGRLIASSRPKIFNSGLISDRMNSEAFHQMQHLKESFFVHEENIGKARYYSAYVPFFNTSNELTAILNLPYFAKQKELHNEISEYLATFLNIVLLLFVITLATSVLLSDYLTKPLKLLRSKISVVMLGKDNEKITWKRHDEIGALIKEYNRMIEELEKSAKLLSKNERELAWREMAKQIAHEIKNPLTPMKLHVQHLQKAWKDKTQNWDEKLDKFTETLTEQIDSLSNIANAFSDFAKISRSDFQIVNITPVIQHVIDLYKDYEDVHIYFGLKEECFVFADREQMNRVFINLIKNAIQAKKTDVPCQINVFIHIKERHYKIRVEDNGVGIPEEKKGKIFSPNFTTKSSGMGLGLAMVKKIIENTGGSIWFESKENKGTTFYFTLPMFENPQYQKQNI